MKKVIYCCLFFLFIPFMEGHAASYAEIDHDRQAWSYTANKNIEASTVNEDSVTLTDAYGQDVPIETTVAGRTLTLAPKEPYINYWKYTLTITSDVKLKNGDAFFTAGKVENFQLIQAIDETSAAISAVNPADYNGQALVTFSYDDGYTNWMKYSLPLHQYYNFPGTYNIIGKYLYDEPDATYMRPSMVWIADQLGMEIASHTQNHVFLPSLSDEDIRAEFENSIDSLAAIDIDAKTLAVPFSSYDERVRAIATEYFDGVRVLNHDYNDVNNYDRHWINSVAVTNTTTFEHIKGWIDGAIRDRAWIIIMWHDIYPDVNRTILDDDAKERYDSTPLILQQTMAYIQEQTKEKILPVSTEEGLALTQ